MVSKSKSNTPNVSVPDHPANSLSYGNEDQISALLKLQPIYMPTNKHTNEEVLDKVRSSYKYLYVVNWLYQCRGYIKLQSEYFDVDLFEIELLNMVYPPPIDESILFINKLKLALISTLQNSKCSSINNFEKIFRLWFGFETALAGNEDDEDETPEPKFDNLLIEDKFEILFTLISYITQYQNFRNYIDKNNVSSDLIRVQSLYSEEVKAGTTEDYISLFDHTRLYKRTIKFPELSIPKKRKLAPEVPEEFFESEQFDIESTSFEIISKNIYEFNSFLLDIYGKRKQKKYKTLYSSLADDMIFESIFNAEIKKRKILTNRRKELQLANLLATRKRSSRLEAKEKQRQEELRLLKLQEEEELRVAGEKRLERRRMMKDQGFNSNHDIPSSTNTLSREERLKLRKLTGESNKTTASPEIESQTIIKSEDAPVQHEVEATKTNEINNDINKEMQMTVTSVGSEHSLTQVDSAVGYTSEQKNHANISNVPDVSNLLPDHQLEHVNNNEEQAASYQRSVGGMPVSYTASLPVQSGIYEKPNQNFHNVPIQLTQNYGSMQNQNYGSMPIQSHDSVLNQSYGSVPTQSYDTAPTQSYGNAPTQMVQNLGNFPVPQTFNTKVDQINRINEPNQAINAIDTNSNQFTERNDTPKADSNQNFDQSQSHEANYGTNH
ncbi:DEHA2D18348p [Debaryomyces hansenii CBS767]|uniref:DEHA2D18348p n=1 Tax=Debaryomyces hansenii (strain ATCC 36239 / CBS 767 / BCRC 21394 / JCM 1990 / NBRC 0083 / IGC 2968) TaxID=284592 RepID=B5RTL7_DEBHA|nr:DEHA2D18348p [Debaryomyces hansenii CBS767]CAR65702.1 DEHA2D18348p [Debaryomyces hansenii CBS767]|eukprot:XP_002770348.1 DEHA2D18348p [Debaryomyces hansenii CBS767]